ncbi:hypothetical protein Poli38472_013834 [Pythium oligandrum]|uniref:Saccharopine dehydrogenase n=1 Tax=Pythium oligandrum TaxID=41045 RepID=A0A8K1C259_PYTOL|nr:hypothetical protein Poli38472_013834 [Pythium oligandrum]|eukprot:TMW55072.1 hypothetical protein Poli38472_013834 [Pythium oligandrum]
MTELVVCFGAGRVAGPLVSYLLRRTNVSVCVASAVPGEAKALCAKYRNSLEGRSEETLTALDVDVMDEGKNSTIVEELCSKAACVVALVPEPAQLRIAQACIKTKTRLVTASYPSVGIKELDDAAKEAGVPMLCEMGLDPGMDHMIAMKMIDEVKAKNGQVVRFTSVCGGLPAPDAANNPIKYKFSWSPIGALRAAQRPAQFLENGNVVKIAGRDILSHARPTELFSGFELEQIPNGNALPYAEHYQISNAKSIFRGTLRYKGFCHVIHQCVKLGLLSESDEIRQGAKWMDLLAAKINTSAMGGLDASTQVFLHWLGLDSPTATIKKTQSIMAAFCDVLLEKLSFASGESDLVLMQVGVEAEYPDGSREFLEALFEEYGESHGDTVMSKTVGVTAAIGVKLLLEGTVSSVGVLSPTLREIYKPSLELLEAEGIHFQETRQSLTTPGP